MKVDLTHPEKNVALLSIELDTDQIEQARQSVYRQMANRYNIPGFRRGKAPMPIVQRFVGQSFFDQEVIDKLINDAYPAAVAEVNIEPVTRPELDLTDWKPGEPLRFTAKVTTKPEVTLGQYTGLEIPREEPMVDEAAVDHDLDSMRQAFAQLVDVPEATPVASGSVAVIDFTGYVDDQAFEGGTAEAYPLEIGSGSFVPGFEDGLVGAMVGEERDVKVTFPVNYAGELGGKEALFKVKVKAHKRRELPAADDEFARKAAPLAGLKAEEGFGIEALRAEVRRRLEAAAARRVATEYEDAVVGKVAELAQMDVPEVMIERATDARRQEYEEMFRRNGADLAQYLAEQEMTEEALRANMRPAATESVRRELVLEAVGRREGIVATEQEVDERIRTFAQLRNEDPAQVRERLAENDGIEQLRDEITRRKVIDYLVGAQVAVAPAAQAATGETPVTPAEVDAEIPAPAEDPK